MRRHRSFFFPLALIAAGVLWLLVNFGTIPAANLWALTHVWPIVLIGLGLSLILRQYWEDAGLVAAALIVFGAVACVLYAPQLGWNSPVDWSVDLHISGAVPGSGSITTESREASGFSAINIRYPGEIIIRQGSEESVRITADDNLQPQLEAVVHSGSLTIQNREPDWGRRVNPSNTVIVEITVTDLGELNFDTAGSVSVEGVSTDQLDVQLSGAGNVNLSDIQVGTLSLRLDGAGNLDANGSADTVSVDIEGLGSFNARDLAAHSATVTVNGVGSATLRVEQSLNVTINGLGSVNYYGSPAIRETRNGLGSITKAGD